MMHNRSETPMRILLVDDEPDILEFLRYGLEREGFEVFHAPDGVQALEMAQRVLPQLIVLDIMMAPMDGVETAKAIKQIEALQGTRLLFLTAMSEQDASRAASEAGVDDYILKPIRPKMFLNRIQQVLKPNITTTSVSREPILRANGIQLLLDGFRVQVHGTDITLSEREYHILYVLISRPGHIFSAQLLAELAWGETLADRLQVSRVINRLRDRIGNKYLRTVRGLGYKFEY
jgi:two-component system alkaline phosphatase synthesis response regulator PhoP